MTLIACPKCGCKLWILKGNGDSACSRCEFEYELERKGEGKGERS